MSAISSLYGSPNPSMLSRDPTGIDPNGVDDSIRLEPAGSMANESVEPTAQSPSVFEHRNHPVYKPAVGLDAIDVAALVGAPPPPPKTPPPKKRRGGTPHNGATKAGETPKAANVGHFSSFDYEDLIPESSSNEPDEYGGETLHTRNLSSSPESVTVDSPPRPTEVKTSSSIFEERVKAAIAMYESDELVLDDDEPTSPDKYRPAMATLDSNRGLAQDKPAVAVKVQSPQAIKGKPLSPIAAVTPVSPTSRVPASPSSVMTRPHSNKTEKSSAPAPKPFNVLGNITETAAEDASIQPQEPEQHTAKPRRHRAFSIERRIKKSKGDSESRQGRDQKRGFFKKLFRGRSKNRDEATKNREPPEVHSPTARASPRAQSSPRSRSQGPASVSPVEETRPTAPAPTPKQNLPVLKPALKSAAERQYQGPPLESQIEGPTSFQAPVDSPKGQVTSTVPAPAVVKTPSLALSPNDASKTGVSPRIFSQDPPDDEHGDPPIFSGRPLSSPSCLNDLRVATTDFEEVHSRIESVKSRIADLYGEHAMAGEARDDHGPITGVPSSLSTDRQEFLFSHDEVSALSGTFGSKSFDPSSSDTKSSGPSVSGSVHSEPTGLSLDHVPSSTKAQDGGPPLNPEEHNVDPYTTKFFDTVEEGSLPTPAHESHLRVEVHGPRVDPAGASPLKWDYRGQPVMNHSFRDPVGESPMHGPKKANQDKDYFDGPTPKAKFLKRRDEIAEEEKKDGEELHQDLPDDEVMIDAKEAETQGTRRKSTGSKAGRSKATRAALKLANTLPADAIKEQIHSIPTPKNSGSSTLRVGSAPNLPAGADPVEEADAVAAQQPEKKLTIETDVEKSGFKSASSTPAAGKKPLTVTAAAFTNAKAVAYLHRLHGEPSPRHSWHASKAKKSEQSPLAVKARRAIAKKSEPVAPPSSKKPSPSDYGAHNFDPSVLDSDVASPKAAPAPKAATPAVPPLEDLRTVKTREGAMFSAYNSKFNGRKPTKKTAPKPETPRAARSSNNQSAGTPKSPTIQPLYSDVILKPGKITGLAVAKGIELRRIKRDEDVASGKSARVILTPKVRTEGRNRFNFVPADESEIKDPIQRAGRRILSKSAIPIQCALRRYLAKRKAIDRMWALIQIQSYFRRWRCEANLQASIHSTVLIQTAFRGWLARDKVKEMQYSATLIQKVVRGYLTQARVYDTIFYVVRIQALLKGCYERKMQRQKANAAQRIQTFVRGCKGRFVAKQNRNAIPIQALYRGHKARQEYSVARASASVIQSLWRSYSARITFQVEVVDIIIVQSVVRRWLACRQAQQLRDLEMFGPASIIQAWYRGYHARVNYKREVAALRIQAAWRGFQCYTDYIFALVDILVVQRTVRQWLARRTVTGMRKENAATQIQATWRRYRAQKVLLYSLVHIIIAQSVARRFLSRFVVQKRVSEVEAITKEEARKFKAATAIQKVWRGFWGYSHYIIIQYEITRLQAVVRAKLARQSYNLRLGCVIIIQATIRRHLARKVVASKLLTDALTEGAILQLRERNAAKRIQFWWRIVLDWTKEKKAALTIERFFIHVREEVDREIRLRERRRLIKKERRRQKRRESDEKMLERAWLNTVDENTAVGFSQDTQSDEGRSKSAPRPSRDAPSPKMPHRTPGLGISHRIPSPRQSSMGQEVDIHGWPIQRVDSSNSVTRPTDAVRMATSEDRSEVSNITNPSVFHRAGHAVVQPSRSQSRDKRMSTEDYIKKYGTAAEKFSPRTGQQQPQHFFSDEASTASRKQRNGTPTAVNGQGPIPMTSSGGSAGTPMSRRRSSSGTPSHRGFINPAMTPRNSAGSSNGTLKPATTPRSSFGDTTPRSQVSSHQLASPRIHVGIPPVTPRSQKRVNSKHAQISRRETAETESHTTFSQGSFSKASPLSRSDGSPVMIVKTNRNISRNRSIEEAQEVLYLGGSLLGEEYGEV